MNPPVVRLPRRLAIARIAAALLVVLWVHWVDWFGPLATAAFFALLAAAGMLLALTYFPRLPQPPALRALTSDDQLAIWIMLTVLAIIVVIRIVLSFSLEVEIDGVWPWNRWRTLGGAARGAPGDAPQ